MITDRHRLVRAALTAVVAAACGDPGGGTSGADAGADAGADTGGWPVALPVGFPVPRLPTGLRPTAELAELGRHLFYDVRLSGNGTQACASCHLQARAFSDGKVTARGSTGEPLLRNSMSLTNVAYASTLAWGNPLLRRLEDQIPIPMFGEEPVELGRRWRCRGRCRGCSPPSTARP
jgi:cytochrome c peroxidase